MATHPPTLATWLLRHFGCSPNNVAIIGDLDERYRQGRSYMWYWKQVIVTTAASFFQEVKSHKLLAISSLLVGRIIKTASQLLAARLLWYVMGPADLRRYISLLLATVAGEIAICALSAWLVSRISRPNDRPMVLLYVLVELVAVPVMLIVGWVSHQPDPAVLLGAPGEISGLWAAPFTAYFAIGLSRLGHPFETVIALWCGCILMTVTMLLAGGILRASPAPGTPRRVA